jgi:exonuclease SbcC
MKILHTGDWHIGNFPGPERNGENVRFNDICHCLDTLVVKAEEAAPDFIVIAGDIFHQAKVWSDRGLKENRTATHYIRLLEKIAPVIIVRGTPNHDSEQQYENLVSAFEGDDSVHIITEPQTLKVYGYHSGVSVQIAGLPGLDRGFYRAKHPGLSKEEENEVFTEELEKIILGLKASCDNSAPTVLVSHFTIPGCNMESGQTAFFSAFEPVVYPSALMAAGFDLNCFGHIHRPQHIDEAGPTYYCGAVSALNFNDEGQERGFYIHDIEADGVHSTFYALPTREYKTIRLEDEDVAKIIGGDMEWLNAENNYSEKVVRVLYSCTDEHNKALNKAALETFLYEGGAFWVQEITPAKISITVNKEAMSDDNSPEEHLRRYFGDKEYSPERIAELIDTAAPFISEAAEAKGSGAHTGVFIPLKIEVKNYRNYRDESFDYDGIRFCTINGENGAGKSSLFMDAMLDALFEEPREGDLTGWICNDPDVRSGSIQFTFSIGEATYRVTRTRTKSGKATLNIAELVEGEWEDRSAERYKDTQAIISDIIGMDSLTLKACGLIMQDQYGLFLQADKEARMNILGNILGLGIYDRMEDLAAAALTNKNREIKSILDKVADITAALPDAGELAAAIEITKKDIADLQKQADEKATEIDGTKVRLNTKVEAMQRAVRIQAEIATLEMKKNTAITNKTTQSLIANGAAAALSEEAQIKAGVAEYEQLLEQEKALISARDRRDDLTERGKALTDEAIALSAAKEKAEKDLQQTTERIATINSKLCDAPLLEEKHAEYLKVQAAVEEMQKSAEEYTSLTKALAEAQAEYAKVESKYALEKRTIDGEIAACEAEATLLENSDCPISEKASCKFLSKAIAAKEKLPEWKANAEELATNESEALAEKQKAVDLARAAVEASKYTPEALNALRANLSALRAYEERYAELATLNSQKETADTLLKTYAAAVEEAEKKLHNTEAERNKVMDDLAKAQEAAGGYDAISAKITAAKAWLEKEKELPAMRERLASANVRMGELETEIAQYDADIAQKREEHAAEKIASEGAADLEKLVKQADEIINGLRTEIQQKSMSLGALTKQAETAEQSRQTAKELQKQTESLAHTASLYEDLKKAFSQDGIPHNVIRSLIPIFEATATGILGQMSGGKMSVEFVTEKVLKSNNKKEVTTLDIIINDCTTGRLPYMSRSGGERVKAALSVILALSEIKSTKAGVQLGFLFIDEPPFLDAQGVQAYCDALEAIQSRYSALKIMAITHDPTMKSRFPQSVDVVKTADGSKVIYQ